MHMHKGLEINAYVQLGNAIVKKTTNNHTGKQCH